MNKTVVLIDDDQDDLDILKEAITAIDATLCCLCFINAADAVHAFANDSVVKPDFVFTDINMPGMTGDRLLQELRNQRQFDRTIITVLSTTIPHHVRNRLKDMGANHTFEKPIHFNDYAPILRTILKN